MKQNGSFAVTLALAVVSGGAIGFMAFGANNPTPPAAVAGNPNAPKPSSADTDSANDPQPVSASDSFGSSGTDTSTPSAQAADSPPQLDDGSLPAPR